MTSRNDLARIAEGAATYLCSAVRRPPRIVTGNGEASAARWVKGLAPGHGEVCYPELINKSMSKGLVLLAPVPRREPCVVVNLQRATTLHANPAVR
jgi:hypothetical protein